jgi:alkylation response protein AidB-like acyl-CoA dehydrogenase
MDIGFSEEHELPCKTARKFLQAECDTKFVRERMASAAAVLDAARWHQRVLGARQYTIAGGTSEIRRNIIGERVLGLPKG